MTALVALIAIELAAAPATRHVYNPKPAAAVDAAIRALSHEWTAAQAGGKIKLRTSCNYFKENRSEDVTPQAIIAALERGTSDSSPQSYYAKWQLLSGIEGNIPDDLVPRAIVVFKNFAPLQLQPGMKQDTRSDLELRRRITREDGVADLNKYISDLQDKVNFANEPILMFRDELFSRLPASYDVVAAGFADAYDRLKAGADTKTIVDAAVTATHQWMAKADAAQLRSLSDSLKTLTKERGTQYYDSASWSDTTRKVSYYKKAPAMDKRTLETLSKELAEQAENPTPGGLKFKDEKKKKDK